ncbi:RND family efflux transporter MFP subunit [Bacillus mesophilus]|uniref:Efflux RND transporter periplasmic adaptor subunit n=1 Tax=Bacillus mesophilus TaxID=1808955 RepID=A0A6M0Q2R3_9BACI|nr:efflux RND transporter periplasmic adaptor subunit [Bacillus mesophilus]MBM7659754.1 RND family efflux transporter MFP subunit [Bacillus mesophilus]NEY70616.1 efflux RND transporter periplasmic adaptor subunit [Bacillus mesophilus]
MRNPIYLLLVILILVSGCSTKEITKQDTGQTQLPVKTDIVMKSTISNTIELSGLAIPHTQIPLFTAQPLQVQKVHVKVGDQVNENDVLISLNNEVATRQLNEARKTVAKLQTALSSAKQAIPTEEQLNEIEQLQKEVQEVLTSTTDLLSQIEPGEITTEEIVQTSLQLSLKQAQLANAVSKLQPFSPASITELEAQLVQANQVVEQAKELVSATEIQSPINGTVASIDVVENGLAPPNMPIATVIQLDQIDATFQVNSFEVVKLQVGTEVSLTFTGIEELFKGKIESISPSINPETNMFTVIIPIENSSNLIKGGMKASANVGIDQVNDALVIPVEAILYENNEPYVFVVENEIAVMRKIETGIRDDQHIQVISGLVLNDQVVTEGQERLNDGDSIYVSN